MRILATCVNTISPQVQVESTLLLWLWRSDMFLAAIAYKVCFMTLVMSGHCRDVMVVMTCVMTVTFSHVDENRDIQGTHSLFVRETLLQPAFEFLRHQIISRGLEQRPSSREACHFPHSLLLYTLLPHMLTLSVTPVVGSASGGAFFTFLQE